MTIPALADAERISSHTISASTGPLNVGFHIYGSSTDYSAWLECWHDDVLLTPVTDFTVTSPSGSVATLPRPITDARVTLTVARTGDIVIVGTERPRRTTQLTEGVGVSATDFNRFATQTVARQREAWDRWLRSTVAIPGESGGPFYVPALATRASMYAGWNSDGEWIAIPEVVLGGGTLANNAVTDAYLRDSGACSVIGRAANSSGDPADIAASANGQLLIRLADAVGFSTITAALDSVFGSTRGMILRREASAWAALALGASGKFLKSDGTDAGWDDPTAGLPQGYGYGCTAANGTDATNDVDFATGRWRDSTNTVDLVGTAMTKRLDADWAAGTGNGGRYSGAAITDTTYHWFLIGKADGTTDYLAYAGVDPTAVLPSGYLYFRRIFSIPRISGVIVAFVQNNDEFLFLAQKGCVSAANPGTSAVVFTVVGVPTGIKVLARMQGYFTFQSTGAGFGLLTSLDQTDVAASVSSFTIWSRTAADPGNFQKDVRTNTSAQLRYRMNDSTGSDGAVILCEGFIDDRGRGAA